MKVLIIGNAGLKEEWQKEIRGDVHIEWMAEPGNAMATYSIDAVIDLLFENNERRIQQLKETKASLIVINSVVASLADIQEDFVRFNGWNTFLKRPVAEAACSNEALKEKTEIIFAAFGKKVEWVPDIPGFITPRVVVSVINEAYFALEEKVSTKEEIDIAMKMGTNYPFGPFEWGSQIGTARIHALLTRLARDQNRYHPAALLTKEALG